MRPRWMIARTIVPLLAAAILLGLSGVARACPSCQQALSTDAAQGDLARGIYYSILFMMSMPFAITGAFAGLFYRMVKREQVRLAQRDARNGDASERPLGDGR